MGLRGAIALAIAVTAVACAVLGGGSDNLPKARGFRVLAPPGWREFDKGEGDRAYQLPSGSVATLNTSCKRTAAPLEVLTRQLLMGSRNVKILKRDNLRIDGADGLHSSLRVTEDGTPLRLEVLVLRKGNCTFDFTLMNAKEIGHGEIADFLTFARSLRYGAD